MTLIVSAWCATIQVSSKNFLNNLPGYAGKIDIIKYNFIFQIHPCNRPTLDKDPPFELHLYLAGYDITKINCQYCTESNCANLDSSAWILTRSL